MKISFHSYANKTNFHMKSFTQSFSLNSYLGSKQLRNGLLIFIESLCVVHFLFVFYFICTAYLLHRADCRADAGKGYAAGCKQSDE